jgi:phosphoglycerate kinase
MNKMTVKDVNFAGKRVLMRVDFNVPMKEGVVGDDTRIKAALPTIKYVLENGAKSLVLMSHLGDPKKDTQKAQEKAEKEGKPFDAKKYSDGKHKMAPVAAHLAKLLGKDVAFSPATVGPDADAVVNALPAGGIALLENTRFDKRETSKETADREALAKELAKFGDVYVNDAFGTAHRAHASTTDAAKFLPACVGFLMEKELQFLSKVAENPEKPFAAILGGAKVSDKILVIEKLMEKCQILIIGGGMAYTFLKAKGESIGNSLLEADRVELAKQLMDKAAAKGIKLVLPVDHVCAKEFGSADTQIQKQVQEGWSGLDVGPESVKLFKDVLSTAKTILWNGPVGVFEMAPYANGTKELAEFLGAIKALVVVGGGDSAAAAKKFNVAEKLTHVSTGGGASLEYLEGKELPGVAIVPVKKASHSCCSCGGCH